MIEVIEYLTQGETESGSSGTLRIDLPENEQIAMLMLELRLTLTSTILNTRSILDMITSIEVIAGGKTLFSLEPEPASHACFVVQDGVLPDHRFFQGASTVQRLHLPIYFGRFRGDEEYLLDTSRYKNPQLVIAWSMNTTYDATGTFVHTCSYVRPLNKMQGVKGFIRWREIKKETTAASVATIRHDLPTDFPWFYLAVRVEDDDQDINTDLTSVLLNIDAGRLRLLDVDADEVNFYDRQRFNQANSYVNQPVVTGTGTIKTFGDWSFPKGAVSVVVGHRLATLTSLAGEQLTLSVYGDTASQAGDAIPVAVDLPSPNPHKCLTLYDGRQEPFPIQSYGQAWVDYTIGAYAINLLTYVAEVITGGL